MSGRVVDPSVVLACPLCGRSAIAAVRQAPSDALSFVARCAGCRVDLVLARAWRVLWLRDRSTESAPDAGGEGLSLPLPGVSPAAGALSVGRVRQEGGARA